MITTSRSPIDGRNLLPRLYAGALKPESFSHRDHLQAGWECLQSGNPREPRRLAASLLALASSAGAAERYHATITGAFLTLIASASRPGENFSTFLSGNPDLEDRRCLLRYYSRERLALPAARQRFLMPDLTPLPHCAQALCGVEIDHLTGPLDASADQSGAQ